MTSTKFGRIGVIVRQDLTGLGVQTRNIAEMLEADKLIVIDFSPLNGNKQHPELLDSLTDNRVNIKGWIHPDHFEEVLKGIDVLITCEIDYTAGYELIARAKELGIKTIVVANYEFCDWLQRPYLPRPDVLANHSEWNNHKLEGIFGKVPILRTPVDTEHYWEVYNENMRVKDKVRFLHVAGRKTHEDRNGTADLLEAIKLINPVIDFELVIKTQTTDVYCNDPRVTIDRSEPTDERELYCGFDAMILPRRYGGASLPMNEALAAGLPVIMTDIDPNNKILPSWWLVDARKKTSFMARTEIDVYESVPASLAGRIAQFAVMSPELFIGTKHAARAIANREFAMAMVKHKWHLLLDELGVE